MATTELDEAAPTEASAAEPWLMEADTQAPEPPAPARGLRFAFDRTAVLALGLLAGFLIGLSFNQAGREQAWGWFFPEEHAPVALPPPARTRPTATLTAAPTPLAAAAIDPRVVRRVAVDGVVHVGVFGDSFGDGVWAALYHQLPPKQHYEVLRFSKEATGFTRYRTLNLEDRAREQVGHQPIDIAVISFGANDVQPIFEEGHLQPLMSDGWKRIIGARIDQFVGVARSTGAAVFWVGLPVMRDGKMDDEITAMNGFYADRMKALGVPFFETRSHSVDKAGAYAPYLPDSVSGEPRLMRAGDGIHMSMLGYQRLTTDLAARLRGFAGALRQRALASGPPTPALLEATSAPAAKPSAKPSPSPSPRATPSSRPSPKPHRAEADDDQATAHANHHEKRREDHDTDANADAKPKPAHHKPAHDDE